MTDRIAPWNPPPNPIPVITVPTKNPGTEPNVTASKVSPAPAIRATPPISISPRGDCRCSSRTAAAPLPASTARDRPYDGANISARMDRDRSAGIRARAAAVTSLDAAIAG
jgi:hypothetical protein